MEGYSKEKCNNENDKCGSSLQIALEGKDNSQLNDHQDNDTKNGKSEANILNSKEADHSNDKLKAIEHGFEPDNTENTLIQMLKNKEELLDAKEELLEEKNKLLEHQDKRLKCLDKRIKGQNAMIQNMKQLVQNLETLLEMAITTKKGIKDIVGRKDTSKCKKSKQLAIDEDDSEMETIEPPEENDKFLEADSKNVLAWITKDEAPTDKPQRTQHSDVEAMDGSSQNLDLSEAMAKLSANATSTGRTASKESYVLSTAAIANATSTARTASKESYALSIAATANPQAETRSRLRPCGDC